MIDNVGLIDGMPDRPESQSLGRMKKSSSMAWRLSSLRLRVMAGGRESPAQSRKRMSRTGPTSSFDPLCWKNVTAPLPEGRSFQALCARDSSPSLLMFPGASTAPDNESPHYLLPDNGLIGRCPQWKISRRCRRGRKSHNDRKQKLRVPGARERVANMRPDFLRKTPGDRRNRIAAVHVEDLKIRNTTRFARGTTDASGRNLRQKAGLNRSILYWPVFGLSLASFGMGNVPVPSGIRAGKEGRKTGPGRSPERGPDLLFRRIRKPCGRKAAKKIERAGQLPVADLRRGGEARPPPDLQVGGSIHPQQRGS